MEFDADQVVSSPYHSAPAPQAISNDQKGNAFRKIRGRVVYALDDLKAWADRGTKTSTSDPGNGTVLPAKRHAGPIPYAGKPRR